MRFLPHTSEDRNAMLDKIGIKHVDELYTHVPKEYYLNQPLNLPFSQGEAAIEKQLSHIAQKNHAAHEGPFFLGAGSYYHHIPASVDHIIQRSELLTAYTPYQPEISQGTLAIIFEFQSMVATLTGMEVANASMYDGSTATAEAALMACRVTNRSNVIIQGHLHPHYQETLHTYFQFIDSTITHNQTPDEKTACVIIQIPDFYGNIESIEQIRAECDAVGALLIVVVTEIISLGLLNAPSLADIVVGEGQSLGNPMQFGGPYVGFFACKSKYLRQMPGRLCGQTVDADNKRSFVLTLSTREQHIRREKATSNICTNQGLCATAFTIHLSLLGETGLKQLALLNHQAACLLADKLSNVNGVTIENTHFFNEFTIQLSKDSQLVSQLLAKQKIIAGHPVAPNRLIVAATEMTSSEDIDLFCQALSDILNAFQESG